MIKVIKKSLISTFAVISAYSLLFISSSVFFVFSSGDLIAQETSKKQVKYKKARALQTSTAKKMAKVYEALEEVDEEGEPAPDMETVLKILNGLLEDKDSLKSYDRSVMWNAWGFVYFSDGDYAKAMQAYESLLAEPEGTIPLRVSALFTLAQLNLVQEDYQKGVDLILQWMDEVDTVTAQAWSLLGQAYFQLGDYKKALSSMETAVKTAEEVEGYKPKENWYVIMAASISELKSEIGEKESLLRQIGIYEILVNLYPKKLYFIQLGGSYGQLNRERDYMITLKAAYQKDLLDKESEYLALAQLLLLNENPYWAAEVLVSGQKKLIKKVDKETEEESFVPVVKDNEKNLKLLADAWRMSQEVKKAIPVLEKASELSKSGDNFVLLGSLYLSVDRLQDAVNAIKKGLDKGKVKNLSQVHLTLGQVYFELQEFENAKKEFRIAARDKDKKIKKTANTWIKYTENEEIRVKNLELRREFIRQAS